MSSRDWLVLIAAAAFFLIGIAISPLAWLVRRQGKLERDEENERRFRQHARDLKELQSRIQQLESQVLKTSTASEDARPGHAAALPWVRRDGAMGLANTATAAEPASPRAAGPPTLIAIPKLASTAQDSDTNLETLSERYAAIWDLADSGSAPEVIARATGQPVGQVELILGLRRQLPGAQARKPLRPLT
jgi:hypothetical protein